MIPRKLELKNFLCYGEAIQTVDFTDYHLICLSGKNGYGKSALLDAITWALWGQARKISGTTKPDAGLLRLGQTRMMVCLEFEVNNKIYRARREFAKTYGKPYAALDFEVYDYSKNSFNSLTDKTIRETQEKIEKTIGLDFETFINSAFLKQGQSNEFSKKTAKERKQILANILNLSKYDVLQQHTLELIRKKTEDKKLYLQLQQQYLQELAQQEAIQKQRLEKQQELTAVQELIKQLTQQQASLTQQKITLEQKKQQREHYLGIHKTLQQEKALKQDQLRSLRISWKNTHGQLLRLINHSTLEKEKSALVEETKKLIEVKQTILTLQEQYLHAKDLYQKELATIKQQHNEQLYSLKVSVEKKDVEYNHLAQQIENITKQQSIQQQAITAIEEEIKLLQKNLANKHSNLSGSQAILKQFDKRRAYYQSFIQQGNYVKNELTNLKHKATIIHDEKSPSCPLCQQILTAKRKSYLHKQFEQEEHFLQHRVERITSILKKLKQLLLEQHKQVENLNKEQTIVTQLTTQLSERINKLATLNQEKASGNQELQRIVTLQKNLLEEVIANKKQLTLLQEEFETGLEKNDVLQKLYTEVVKLETKKHQIAFDHERYNHLQKRIQEIEQTLLKISTAEQERAKQEERKLTIKQLCKELKTIDQKLLQSNKELNQLTVELEQEQTLFNNITSLANQLANHTAQKDVLLQQIGKAEHELERLTAIQQKYKDQEKILRVLEDETDDYQILAQAFSKNGMQALLIEEAIPEVEQEANKILAKLTNNQSQIFIESLRDLKSGGVRETLDIKITDAIGIRPYEMFSGGEAFRIDFALRIAISKLLARRAGTALQTLIIDEGFGSQDEEGLALLMNAMHSIQEDFSKVIIVSHLPEFKDNFPVHFIVNKHASGSLITVEERG